MRSGQGDVKAGGTHLVIIITTLFSYFAHLMLTNFIVTSNNYTRDLENDLQLISASLHV